MKKFRLPYQKTNKILIDVTYINLYFLFVVSCVTYFLIFVFDKGFSYEPIEGYFYPVNIHDHHIYLKYLQSIWDGKEGLVGLNNNFGIALVYYPLFYVSDYFGFGKEISFYIYPLIVNLMVFLFCSISYRNIIKFLNIPRLYELTFYMCSSFLYFSQLINKDSFTILVFLKSIEYVLQDKRKLFYIVVCLSFFIRIQLVPLLLLFLFLSKERKLYLTTYVCTYISFSLLNGWFSKNFSLLLFNKETLSDGLSFYLYTLNDKYYVGSLILNPIRCLQYFYSYLLSFGFINDGNVDVSRLKDIPQLLLLIYYAPRLLEIFLNMRLVMRTEARVFVAFIASFFIIWNFNPTINSRYFICLLPVIFLLSIFYKNNKMRCC